MIALIDYGMGNLRSVQKAVEKAGGTVQITHTPDDILRAEKIILPGVGAIRPAMDELTRLGLTYAIQKAVTDQKPFLGICLGFQLLFEYSNEGGRVPGLGIIPGSVERFLPGNGAKKVPHMGWNQIMIHQKDCPLFADIPDGTNAYFCHSYYAKPTNETMIAAYTEYGITFASAICHGSVFGVQFHPEKSQAVGLTILKNFVRIRS